MQFRCASSSVLDLRGGSLDLERKDPLVTLPRPRPTPSPNRPSRTSSMQATPASAGPLRDCGALVIYITGCTAQFDSHYHRKLSQTWTSNFAPKGKPRGGRYRESKPIPFECGWNADPGRDGCALFICSGVVPRAKVPPSSPNSGRTFRSYSVRCFSSVDMARLSPGAATRGSGAGGHDQQQTRAPE